MARIFHHNYYVYILTNFSKTVLYIGVSNDLCRRITEHWINRGMPETFAGKYYCYNLVYYEHFQYVKDAIAREKELKGWRKEKKIALIKTMNPDLCFLNAEVCSQWPPEGRFL